MSIADTYRPINNNRLNQCSYLYKWHLRIIVLLIIGLHPLHLFSQSATTVKLAVFKNLLPDTLVGGQSDGPDYDEVSVTLNVPRIGSIELPAVVYREKLYLPIRELFDFLKIKNTISPDFDLVQGFFIDPKNSYYIEKTNNRIAYQYKEYQLEAKDLIQTPTNLYLNSDLFGKIFGLDCVFDFRSLSVSLTTKIELPVIREMQQELMRRNITRLKGEKKADTTFGREFPLFHLGMADWTVVSSQETKGTGYTRVNVGLGGVVAGGETNLSLNYFSGESLNLRQQSYQWHYVNNDHKALRQVTIGKIYPQSISSLFAPVIGIQFTNAATTYRKSFGTYTISNTTEPGWTVELYVNNVLLNYTKADGSGFFTFEVPMIYGNSVVKLRFYGPWGEEQMSEKYISVPFNFVPAKQLEYTISSGIVDDNNKGRYSRANLNYGLNRHITIGGGMEYLSTVTSGKTMPFLQASVMIGSRLLMSGEHTYGVRSKATLNYRLLSNLQVDATYIKYARDQTAINVNHIEEKKLVLSKPLKTGKFNSFSRLTLDQFTFPFKSLFGGKNRARYTSAEYLFSSTLAGITSNLTTFAIFNDGQSPLVYSNLSLAFRLPGGLRLSPQAQYEYRQKKFSMLKGELEKNLSGRGYINLSYQKDFLNNRNSVLTLGVRYNVSFAQAYFSTSRTSQSTITNQYVRGSILYDGNTNYLGFSNLNNKGKGGIVVSPFLDLNCNGKRDSNEPKASGLNIQVNGGRIENNPRDTTIRISGLEAYTSYYLELDGNGFDNIAWQIRKHTLKVIVDPNRFKLIEVPVAVVAEVSGTVSLKGKEGIKGLGRMIVIIRDIQSNIVARVQTESDGFFSYIGLAPGAYTASVDSLQLNKLNMTGAPVLPFKVVENKDGDVVSNLLFVLSLQSP